MCAQLEILKKIREKGETNGFAVDLAEAQMKDYVDMNQKVAKIEKTVSGIQKDLASVKTEQARQGGMIEAIFNRLNSPVDEERLAGQKWNLLTSVAKHKSAWVILTLFLFSFSFAGERIANILEKIVMKLVG